MLSNKPQPIGLKDMIERIKQELREDHSQSDPMFLIGKVEVEISFTVERNMNGGIDFQVIQTGVQKTMSTVQMVRVTLEPLSPVLEMRQNIGKTKKRKAEEALTRTYPEPEEK